MSEFQKDELSLEETNKLRIQLGLKPLVADSDDEEEVKGSKEEGRGKGKVAEEEDDDDDPLKNQEEKAAKNYAEFQSSMRKKREEDEVKERIAKAKNKIELNKRLQGTTLGEERGQPSSSSSSTSTKIWLKEQRKKAIANEERRRQEEQEAEAAASAALRSKYDTNDLSGLRVGHDVEEFDLEEGGEGRILTLRDRKILDEDDEDELMDSTLDQKERDRINEERKKGVKKYSGLDDEEFEAENVGRSRGVLRKYDADIHGPDGPPREADSGFRLGGEVRSRKDRDDEKRMETQRSLNRTLLNLDYTKNEEMSDYLKEGDVGFKKPKAKKKKRIASKIRLDEDEQDIDSNQVDTEMKDAIDSGADRKPSVSNERYRNKEIDLIDDEDLALSLAKARRKQAKKTFQKMTPEMIARNLAEQKAAEEAEQNAARAATATSNGTLKDENSGNDGGLYFDETSEFVRNIQAAREASPETDLRQRPAAGEVKKEVKVEERDLQGEKEENGIDATEMLIEVPTVKEEMESDDEGVTMTNESDNPALPPTLEEIEPLVSGGLGSTLSLLRNQGLLSESTVEERERERQQKEYDSWLAMRRAEDRAREAELAASKAQGSAKDQATREYENKMRELEDAKKAQDRFKDYKPDFEIKYHDEFGRVLNNHEAWKRLSHTFHGKAPGKKKQEQRLQKIENEKKRERMLAGDNMSGMTKAFADRAERSGQAHMVLSVGAKNNAPQDMGILGPNTVSRTAGQWKGKSRQNGDNQNDPSNDNIAPGVGRDMGSGFQSDITGITSMVPRSTTSKVKAGFTPIAARDSLLAVSSTVPAGSSSSNSPVPPIDGSSNTAQPNASKFKLAFGKRPAPSSSTISSLNQPPAKQAREM